ncbi:hypothetical protein WJX73_004616 [Symbiochloris irregularis]|uniref:Protein kinase domain-containing protein n=1 Tax=Symbiochloris irregularis TaxID=706552 RepID=A0AAW1PHQ6_9CHLO
MGLLVGGVACLAAAVTLKKACGSARLRLSVRRPWARSATIYAAQPPHGALGTVRQVQETPLSENQEGVVKVEETVPEEKHVADAVTRDYFAWQHCQSGNSAVQPLQKGPLVTDSRELPRPDAGRISCLPVDTLSYIQRVGSSAVTHLAQVVHISPSRATAIMAEYVQATTVSQEWRDALSHEVQVLQALEGHPNFLSLAGWIVEPTHSGSGVVGVAYATGPCWTLAEAARMSGAVPPVAARHLFSQVLGALGHMHDQGWFHLGLGLQKVLISRDGTRAYVTGFADARHDGRYEHMNNYELQDPILPSSASRMDLLEVGMMVLEVLTPQAFALYRHSAEGILWAVNGLPHPFREVLLEIFAATEAEPSAASLSQQLAFQGGDRCPSADAAPARCGSNREEPAASPCEESRLEADAPSGASASF